MSVEPMQELRGNLHAEMGKAWSVWAPSLWLLASAVICLVTASSLANDFEHSISTGQQPPNARMPVMDALGSGVTFAQVAVVGFAVHLVTPEYASGSIGPTLLAQPRRWVVVAAKALTAMSGAAVLGLPAGVFTSKVIELVLGGAAGSRIDIASAGFATAAIFACAAVVGVALAFLLRSAVGALCAGFVLLVVTVAAPDAVDGWLPGPAQASWLTDVASGEVSRGGFGVVLVWAAGLLAAAVWWVRRRDV